MAVEALTEQCEVKEMNGASDGVPQRRSRSRGWRGPSRGAALRRMAGLAAGAGIALLMAACGGGPHPAGSGASTSPNFAAEVNSYAQCLRAHGQPNVSVSSDPGSSNSSSTVMTLHGFAVEGANPALPQVQAAMHACQHLLPQGSPPPTAALHQQFLRVLRSSRCMRGHGYPNWPDPRVVNGHVGNPYPAPGSGFDTQSPQFQAAAKTCGVSAPSG